MTSTESASVSASCGGSVLSSRREAIGLEPASAYEAVTRQMVLGVSEELLRSVAIRWATCGATLQNSDGEGNR